MQGAAMSKGRAARVAPEAPPDQPPDQPHTPYVRALGADLAVDFLLAFGGASLYFARSPSDRAAAVALVGQDGVIALEREIGQRAGRVPLAKQWIAQYLKAHRDLKVQEIARRMHASDVSVRAWLRGEAPSGKLNRNQLPLL